MPTMTIENAKAIKSAIEYTLNEVKQAPIYPDDLDDMDKVLSTSTEPEIAILHKVTPEDVNTAYAIVRAYDAAQIAVADFIHTNNVSLSDDAINTLIEKVTFAFMTDPDEARVLREIITTQLELQ